jgi:hypothetical protein
MPNVLVLSFEGFSFSARQLYEHLLPKLLSRATVHESLTIQDSLNYIKSGWPSVILVTDAVIAATKEENQQLLSTVADYTWQGCTTILMGFFSSSIEPQVANAMFKEQFGLRWEIEQQTAMYETNIAVPDLNSIRTRTLVRSFLPEAVYLRRVPSSEAVYIASLTGTTLTYAALGRVGLGKVGYVGDAGFGDEPERLILAMCHLERSEDFLEGADDDNV